MANLESTMNQCKICGAESPCQCFTKLMSAKNSFVVLDTCQTCRHSLSGVRGSTNLVCDLADSGIVPSNGFCNQHTDLEIS